MQAETAGAAGQCLSHLSKLLKCAQHFIVKFFLEEKWSEKTVFNILTWHFKLVDHVVWWWYYDPAKRIWISAKLGVGMSPHRICENFQQKPPIFPQKSLFKITDISSFKFDGAHPSWFKIEMQWHCCRDPRDFSRNEWYKYSNASEEHDLSPCAAPYNCTSSCFCLFKWWFRSEVDNNCRSSKRSDRTVHKFSHCKWWQHWSIYAAKWD